MSSESPNKQYLAWFWNQNDYTKSSFIITAYFLGYLAIIVLIVLFLIFLGSGSNFSLAAPSAFIPLFIWFILFKLFYKEANKLAKETIRVLAILSFFIALSLLIPFFIFLSIILVSMLIILSSIFGFYGLHRAAKEEKPLLIPSVIAIISFSLVFFLTGAVYLTFFQPSHGGLL